MRMLSWIQRVWMRNTNKLYDLLILGPNNCTNPTHGICLVNGECSCKAEYTGEHCGFRRCPSNCN